MTLTMTILLSLCLTMIEGARMSTIRLESEIVAQISFNSALAEYHRELMKRFNIFAIDSSYGGKQSGISHLGNRIMYYADVNTNLSDVFLSNTLYRDFLAMYPGGVDVTGVRYLSDGEGDVFRRRCAEAMKSDMGLDILESVIEWADTVTSEGYENCDLMSVIDEKEDYIENNRRKIFEEDEVPPDYSSPVSSVKRFGRSGILSIAVPDADNLSGRTLREDTILSSRRATGKINAGNMDLEDEAVWEDVTEKLFFVEYLMRYVGYYGQTSDDDALLYGVEQTICGKNSDIDNLRGVADRLFILRCGADYAYLMTDSTKVAEAEALGTAIALLLLTPSLADPLKELILAGWALMEAVYDVKTLFAGGRIPLIKSKSTWHYGMGAALGGKEDKGNSSGSGLCYGDYLRIFMFLTGTKKLTSRAMDLVEADIRLTAGNANFRLDACIDAFEASLCVVSAYGYSYEIKRRACYE